MSSSENPRFEPDDLPDEETLKIDLEREIVLLESGIHPDRVARIAALNDRMRRMRRNRQEESESERDD